MTYLLKGPLVKEKKGGEKGGVADSWHESGGVVVRLPKESLIE